MGRAKRITLGGYAYHVLNRANGRLHIFRKDGDFAAFESILASGVAAVMRYPEESKGECRKH
jgi:putative transposase